MTFPHPKSRKGQQRNENKPSGSGLVWNLVKRAINIADDRNGKDDVNPAKNRTYSGLVHHSRLLSRPRRPAGRLNKEQPGVLRVQPLPAGELHGISVDDASNGLTGEQPIQNIESNVPAGGTPRDEAGVDVVPQRQARAASKGFEFPPGIAVLQHLGGVGSRHACFDRLGCPRPGELHCSASLRPFSPAPRGPDLVCTARDHSSGRRFACQLDKLNEVAAGIVQHRDR